jgi:hypothetical protein
MLHNVWQCTYTTLSYTPMSDNHLIPQHIHIERSENGCLTWMCMIRLYMYTAKHCVTLLCIHKVVINRQKNVVYYRKDQKTGKQVELQF